MLYSIYSALSSSLVLSERPSTSPFPFVPILYSTFTYNAVSVNTKLINLIFLNFKIQIRKTNIMSNQLLNDEILDECQCATSRNSHFTDTPISLECGHISCKSCLEECKIKELKCKKCDKLINSDNLKFQENFLAKKLIEFHVDSFLKCIQTKFESSFDTLKGILSYYN